MCGIAGIARRDGESIDREALSRMAAAIRHRGPDGYGFLVDRRVGLAHLRLSILDLERGDQPLSNEDGRLWITYNGEIYNWTALRDELAARGHRFRTSTDTEVIVHAWEEWGRDMLDRFNGQFAFALYDRRDDSLVLARDRFGVRPLFYAVRDGTFAFASEAKALFASGTVDAALDPHGLGEVFTLWAARAPRTVFRDVFQLEPGGWARWAEGSLTTGRWFSLDFPEAPDEPSNAVESLDALMQSSVAMRMRADVPVGAYLSGGLDSSITCTLATPHTPHSLRTFSVAFADPALDESSHQLAVASAIGSEHAVQRIETREIADVFPAVVRHAETPLLRTAPAPMYLLAKLARERGITVVLTGEGSDELFLGYDLFKESEVRRFCLRQPDSSCRPRLFDRLYPYLRDPSAGGGMWRQFFLDAGPPTDPLFSHQPRIRLASFIHDFFGDALRDSATRANTESALRFSLPSGFTRWSTTAQAQYLEMTTLLEGYLLSSQGDRMAMAHGVEGRYPFLDHRLFAFASALPPRSKLCGLRDKQILRRWSRSLLPAGVADRPKQPYRAPDAPAFLGMTRDRAPDYVDVLLGPDALRSTGLFNPKGVEGLIRRCRSGRSISVREQQAFVGVLSAQIWHDTFLGSQPKPAPLPFDKASVYVTAGQALSPTDASSRWTTEARF